MVVDCERHALSTLPLEKIPVAHCTGRCVGPQGRSGGVWKISPPPGIDPQTIQLVEYANRGRPISDVAVLKRHYDWETRKLNMVGCSIKQFWKCTTFQSELFSSIVLNLLKSPCSYAFMASREVVKFQSLPSEGTYFPAAVRGRRFICVHTMNFYEFVAETSQFLISPCLHICGWPFSSSVTRNI
jgi:hypothetical protein